MLFFALSGDNFDGNTFAPQALKKGAIAVVVDNPEYEKQNCILVEDALTALQNLARHHRKTLQTPVIALTGSNGKTTTKELIASVLAEKYEVMATQGNLNNHIGVPLSLLKLKKTTERAVIEMGANHQGEIAALCKIAQPDYGLITNFGKAHLEGFGGIEGVIKGKSELYNFVKSHNGKLFVNADDAVQMEKSAEIERFEFGEKPEAEVKVKFKRADPFVVMEYRGQPIESQLIGNYNAANIASAVAIGDYFQVPADGIKKAIENYRPVNNRSQIIENDDQKIILDAYNANPTSVKAALENLDQMTATAKTVILGDMFEIGEDALQEHQQIVDQLESMNLKHAFVCGEDFVKTRSEKVQKFKTTNALRRYLQTEEVPEKGLFLIKGSRGMAMEDVLEDL